MYSFTPISALIGGVLIGLAAVWLMASHGRIAGISGILGGIFRRGTDSQEREWRVAFMLGLILVPLIMGLIWPSLKISEFKLTGWPIALAGILVGIGTQLGNGCTSGHGVCGNARLSARSITATIVFMITGIATVFLSKYLGLYL